MSEWHRRLLGLGLPCLLTWVIDFALTLHGQPPEYWAGDYSRTAGVGGHVLFLGLVGVLLVRFTGTLGGGIGSRRSVRQHLGRVLVGRTVLGHARVRLTGGGELVSGEERSVPGDGRGDRNRRLVGGPCFGVVIRRRFRREVVGC